MPLDGTELEAFGNSPLAKLGAGIVNLAARSMLVASVAQRLGSEGPLLAHCAAPL
jgi:hypothetical protein